VKNPNLLKSFQFAINGIRSAWKRERNFRIHCWISTVVLMLSFYLQLNPVQWCIILFCIGTVFSMELINTSIESVVDLVSPEHSELARIAKDSSAGAVLCVTIMSVIVGCIVLVPLLIETFS
jgi:diacylglycerol kinase